ncbi:MAG: SDR family oxidoreductase, partial [Thermoanaerobaculum sp.]
VVGQATTGTVVALRPVNVRASETTTRAAMAVGGAAVPEGFCALLASILGVPVHEAYGATEVGTIAQNGALRPGMDARLVDRPDLGFSHKDQPYPRGELAVKLPRYALPPSDASRITDDGYYLTGDLVELRPDGTIKVLGRTGAALKLADGQFVLAQEIEHALLATGLCQQAAVLFSAAGPVAVVVAAPAVPREKLKGQLAGVLAQRFPGRALPAIVVDPENTPWTPENGLLTPSLKPNRAAIAEFYRHLLPPAQKTAALPETEPPTAGNLLELLAQILHREEQKLDLTLPLVQQGLDSLACAEILSLADARAVPLTVEEVRLLPLEELLEKLQQLPGIRSKPAFPPQGATKAPVTASREDEVALQVLRTPLPQTIPEFSPYGLTVLTGATGFLGIRLLVELAARPPAGGPVVALVRAQNHEHARQRLADAARRAAISIPEAGLPGDAGKSIWAVAADLSHPQLGLSNELFTRLARETAVIVHAAASVQHGARFAELVENNVTPTRNLLQFAVTQRLKAFHLVSTLDVTRLGLSLGAGGSEEAPLPPRLGEAAAKADGYVLTKWVS